MVERRECSKKRVEAFKLCLPVPKRPTRPSPKKHLEGATADAKPA
jgi:hypothetical protein